MTRNLVVHYKRTTYLVEPNDETKSLAGSKRQVEVHEDADGRVEIRYEGRSLPYSDYGQQAIVPTGEIVENKRLGAVLALVQQDQQRRDTERLGSPRITLRQKERIRATRAGAKRPEDREGRAASDRPLCDEGSDGLTAMSEFLARFTAEQKAKRKRHNDVTNQRKREREMAAALARTGGQREGSVPSGGRE